MCDKAKMAMQKIENEFTNPYSWFKQDMNKHYLNQLQVVNNIADVNSLNHEFLKKIHEMGCRILIDDFRELLK